MKVTILGSGDAIGMPVPLCSCEFCRESTPRAHPALLVETESTTVVLDAGPDVPEQLRHVGVDVPDAFFVTHAHRDHAWGLFRLLAPAKFPATVLESSEEFVASDPDTYTPEYAVYLTETAHDHLQAVTTLERLDVRHVSAGEPVEVGDVTVTPFPVEHARPTHDTQGFVVRADGDTVGYAPDMLGFEAEPPDANLDLFVTEGASALGHQIHGSPERRREAMAVADADRTVLVNVSEHIQQVHTDELRAQAARLGYELGRDFETYGFD